MAARVGDPARSPPPCSTARPDKPSWASEPAYRKNGRVEASPIRGMQQRRRPDDERKRPDRNRLGRARRGQGNLRCGGASRLDSRQAGAAPGPAQGQLPAHRGGGRQVRRVAGRDDSPRRRRPGSHGGHRTVLGGAGRTALGRASLPGPGHRRPEVRLPLRPQPAAPQQDRPLGRRRPRPLRGGALPGTVVPPPPRSTANCRR